MQKGMQGFVAQHESSRDGAGWQLGMQRAGAEEALACRAWAAQEARGARSKRRPGNQHREEVGGG